MQNIIKHKRISSLAILMILVIAFAMSIDKSVGADNFCTTSFESRPTVILPDNYFEVMYYNSICSVSSPTKLSVFNVENGIEVGTTGFANIDPGKGAIKSFFDPDGPGERRNIIAKIIVRCPKQHLKFAKGDEASAILCMVESNSGNEPVCISIDVRAICLQ